MRDGEGANVSKAIRNVRVNRKNMAFATGIDKEYRRKSISLGGDMHAATDIGNCGRNQEDAVLLMTHPNNEMFKMMVVADGVGGSNLGEEASATAVDMARKWFKKLDTKAFIDVKGIKFRELISNIDRTICDKLGPGNGGTTFVCAVIGKYETVIVNIGDSRAYTVNRQGIHQITIDDSLIGDVLDKKVGLNELHGKLRANISVAYKLFKEGKLKKDDIRFLNGSNFITSSLGNGTFLDGTHKAHIKTVRNIDYSTLILCSDGLHDCISDAQLLCICRKTPREKVAKMIVDRAIKTTSYVRGELIGEEAFSEIIHGGKDNTTAAVYSKPRKSIKDFVGSFFGDRGR